MLNRLYLFAAAASMMAMACSNKKQDAAPKAAEASAAAPAAAPTPTPTPEPTAAPANDIVAVAAGSDDFKTLVAAVKAAGLVETLQGAGPFTVFAPNEAAFAKLPPGTVEGLLADKAKLTAVLTYHVVPGKVMAADVAGLKEAGTVQGNKLSIDTTDGVVVGGARVIKADIEASNGVIHVIDTVLIPE